MKTNDDHQGLFKSVFAAHFVLFLHVFLIAGIGLLVLFFRGVIFYMPWIVLGGTAVAAGGTYLLYRRARSEGKSLKEMLALPMFRNRSVEVSFLGGLASLRVAPSHEAERLGSTVDESAPQLEDPQTVHVRELTDLVRLLDSNLLTLEEYNKAKKKLLDS